ncbi:hypothetical protein Taro_027477 [Colocasia esculenta]|uniref:Uncharacterized protein n=1 Tax=Colocasia esculenta TaxID=4460 RepID=A0A843VRM8_COLES|nr:hypothetical protein [Colocasia esculenta]
MACREEETWVAFEDDEEALSLCDLPVVDRGEADGDCCGANSGEEGDDAGTAKSPEADDFEFRTCSGGLQLESAEAEMCVADEVFFQGQILPLRPSVSSDSGLFPASRGPSRCGSRSDSMDHYSSATGSLGFESSRSMSGRSSSSISRSQSTHSSNSASSCANEAPARLSVSNNFYAHPSPKPHVCSRRKSTSSARKSTSSAGSGWGLLRLGLVKTPEIDLDGLRHRKPSAAANNSPSNRRVANDDSGRAEKKGPTQGNVRCSSSSSSSNTKFDARGNGSHKEEKPAEKKGSWSLGNRLRCSCSPGDVVETTCSRIVVAGGPERERARLAPSSSFKRRQEGACQSRTFQWLAELPVPKPPVA